MGILMSTSCIGDVSVIEVYINIYSLNYMLEKSNKKSIFKYHNVVAFTLDEFFNPFTENNSFFCC